MHRNFMFGLLCILKPKNLTFKILIPKNLGFSNKPNRSSFQRHMHKMSSKIITDYYGIDQKPMLFTDRYANY